MDILRIALVIVGLAFFQHQPGKDWKNAIESSEAGSHHSKKSKTSMSASTSNFSSNSSINSSNPSSLASTEEGSFDY